MNLNQMARDTGLRPPRRPLSDADKLKYVRELVIENHLDWEAGETEIVMQLYLFEGLEKAFNGACAFARAQERRQLEELREIFMDPGRRSVEDHVQRVEDADLPKDDPSIRDLFGGPNWRTRVAEYFGFR